MMLFFELGMVIILWFPSNATYASSENFQDAHPEIESPWTIYFWDASGA